MMKAMDKMEWLFCPTCRSKTRVKVFEKTELNNFPLFCPKCKKEVKINVKKFNISIIQEPDTTDAEPINV